MALFHIPRITRGYGVAYQSLNNSILSIETALNDSVNNIFTEEGKDARDFVGGVWNMMLLGNITFNGSNGQGELLTLYSPKPLPEQIIPHSEMIKSNPQANQWQLTLICDEEAFPLRDQVLIKHRIIAEALGDPQNDVKCFFQTVIRS